MPKIKDIIKSGVDKLINEVSADEWGMNLLPSDSPFGKSNPVKTLQKFKSVDGNDTESKLAVADTAIELAKANLQQLGVNPGDLDHIYTIAMLSEKPFTMHFKIKEKDKDEFGSDIITAEFHGRAKVNNGLTSVEKGTLGIDLEQVNARGEKSDIEGPLIFNPKELDVNITSTRKSVKGLEKGKNYTIKLGGGMKASDKPNEGEDEPQQVYKAYATILGLIGLNIYEQMGANKDFPLPNGFIENAVAKQDDKLLLKYYNKYKENFEVNEKEFLTRVKDDNFMKAASWMSRNKKAGVGKGLWARIAEEFPEFEMEGRSKQIVAKPGKEAGKPVDKGDKYIQDSRLSLLNVLMESVAQDKWTKIMGFPLDSDKFKNLITNLERILGLLSTQYGLSYNKYNVKEYVGKFINESIIREAEEGDKPNEEVFYLLHLDGIELVTGEKESPEKKEKDKKKFASRGIIPAGGSGIKILKSSNPSLWEASKVSEINKYISSGKVGVRKSHQDGNNIVIELPNDSAVVVKSASGENLMNYFISGGAPGKGIKNMKVIVGHKMGGDDKLENDAEAQLTLMPKK